MPRQRARLSASSRAALGASCKPSSSQNTTETGCTLRRAAATICWSTTAQVALADEAGRWDRSPSRRWTRRWATDVPASASTSWSWRRKPRGLQPRLQERLFRLRSPQVGPGAHGRSTDADERGNQCQRGLVEDHGARCPQPPRQRRAMRTTQNPGRAHAEPLVRSRPVLAVPRGRRAPPRSA